MCVCVCVRGFIVCVCARVQNTHRSSKLTCVAAVQTSMMDGLYAHTHRQAGLVIVSE